MKKGLLEKLVQPEETPLDEKLMDIILLVAPVLGLLFMVLTYAFEIKPWHLPWVIAFMSIFLYGLRKFKNFIPLRAQMLLFISVLYGFNFYITFNEQGNLNDFYIFLVPLVGSLLLFRKNYILITFINLAVVLSIAQYQFGDGFFNSVPVNDSFISLKLNYLLLALVLMICIYVLTENILVERNRLKAKGIELEEINSDLEGKNQELKKVTGVQRRMLAIISHDIKNPIDSLTGMVSLLNRNILSPEELELITSQLQKQLSMTSHNLSNLLNWARSQSEKVVIRKESIELYLTIKETLGFLGKLSKNLDIIVSVPKDTKVCGDIYVLQVVLRNLISNAIKFTPEGGKIEIMSQSKNDLVQIDIKDSGIGIENHIKEKLFNERITTRGTNGEKGNGFGLSLVKEYTKANGGEIWLESETNKGSIFSFTIPSCNCQPELDEECPKH